MRLGYADPPYIGQSAKHYGDHPDYAGEVDHRELLARLDRDYDGWLLHCSSPSLAEILRYVDELGIEGFRVMAWVKPFAAFKPNVPVAYAWEPVLVKPCRTPAVGGGYHYARLDRGADHDATRACRREARGRVRVGIRGHGRATDR